MDAAIEVGSKDNDEEVSISSDGTKAVSLGLSVFSSEIEGYIEDICSKLNKNEDMSVWKAIKILEEDEIVIGSLSANDKIEIQDVISKANAEFNDDIESAIADQRYKFISSVVNKCVTKAKVNGVKREETKSDKIDKIFMVVNF